MSDRVKAVLAEIEALSDGEREELTRAIRKSLWSQWFKISEELGQEAAERGIDDEAITAAVMRARYGSTAERP